MTVRRAALDAGAANWTIVGEEDGYLRTCQHVEWATLIYDRWHVAWRAAGGPPKAEPDADVGPAAPQAPLLI